MLYVHKQCYGKFYTFPLPSSRCDFQHGVSRSFCRNENVCFTILLSCQLCTWMRTQCIEFWYCVSFYDWLRSVQFHPTALADEGLPIKSIDPWDNAFLISEAVRCHEGILYNLAMERFMPWLKILTLLWEFYVSKVCCLLENWLKMLQIFYFWIVDGKSLELE